MDTKPILNTLNVALKATMIAQIAVRQSMATALGGAGSEVDIIALNNIDDCLIHQRTMLLACVLLVEGIEEMDTITHLNKCLEASQ